MPCAAASPRYPLGLSLPWSCSCSLRVCSTARAGGYSAPQTTRVEPHAALRQCHRAGHRVRGDGLKIFVVFMQVSSAFPKTVPMITLPTACTAFLAWFNWANLDVIGMLGLDCLGTQFDYRARVSLSCAIPVRLCWCRACMGTAAVG